jgi:hypothetical protein
MSVNLKNTSIREVNINSFEFDTEIKKIISAANPMAICRNEKSDFNLDNVELLLTAFPIIGYFKKGKFLLCSGLFSFTTIVQMNKDSAKKINVIAFNEKPKPKEIRQLFLTYLASQMINQFYISDSSHIGTLLNAWFIKDENAKSIQASQEWQSLFPNLNTKEVLTKHIGIRKRNL